MAAGVNTELLLYNRVGGAYAFDGKALTIYNGAILYDKAHNVYLQMAVTNGVIPTLVYMFIIAKNQM